MATERLLFCCDNLFDRLQYPGHVGSADETAANFEWWHVADWRRQFGDRWQPTTANVAHYLQVLCNIPRAADFLVLDRGHNWATRTLNLQASGDSFTVGSGIADLVGAIALPTIPGGNLAGGVGAVTSEGAWAKTFGVTMNQGWRVAFAAGGAGVIPQVVGCWLGKAWQPTSFLLNHPAQDRVWSTTRTRTRSAYGWQGSSRPVRFRTGTLRIQAADELDYDMIEWQVLDLYARGFPAWICHDKVDGSRDLMLVSCPDTTLDWGTRQGYKRRGLIEIPFEEEQAAL
jgi:hypothetical protein